MSTFGNLLIKLILDLLQSFKLQNTKRKQLIRKAKYTFFVMKLWFCMQLQLHILWKPLPLKGIFVQYTVCFDPSYIVKNQDESIRGFRLLLDKLKVWNNYHLQIISKSKGVIQIFCQKYSDFTLWDVWGIWHFKRESMNYWILLYLEKHFVMLMQAFIQALFYSR